MKEKTKSFISGAISAIVVTSMITGVSAAVMKTIDVSFNDIKIVVDGTKIEPKDAAGNAVEPFIYNGTTYLPVRAVGAAFGKEVSWDGEKNEVSLRTVQLSSIDLPAGTYIFGEDIEPGKYDLSAVDGTGYFHFTKLGSKYTDTSLMIGKGDKDIFAEEYRGLRTNKGDTLEIFSNVVIKFTKVG